MPTLTRSARDRLSRRDIQSLGTAGGYEHVVFGGHEYRLSSRPIGEGLAGDPLKADEIRVSEPRTTNEGGYETRSQAVYRGLRVPRAAPFDWPTERALQGYLVARALHRWAHLPGLWLGRRGRLTDRGVDLAVRHRGRLAGLPAFHPQRLRHTFIQQYLADGGSGRDLMRLVGWRSRQLLGRYRTGSLAERPRAEWLRLGDRL